MMSLGPVRELDFDKFKFGKSDSRYDPIDEEFIDDFVEFLLENGDSHSNLYNSIEALKCFFKFLKMVGLIKSNPTAYYPNPYYKLRKVDRAFSKEDASKLLSASKKVDPFFGQFYLLMLLFLTCGLRAQEVCLMKKSQVNLEFQTIEITRGQKTSASVVSVVDKLKEAFEQYFEHPEWLRWSKGQDKEVFFYNNKPLNRSRLVSMLQLIYDEAGIDRQVRVHDLRHTMAQLLLLNGANEFSIQEQLRHERIETTMHYLNYNMNYRTYLESHSDTLL
ncbi:tyrosine-type recombinase/integrase [Pontibacillus yanchengensis]|uniref:Tyrosine-type recombinase/integrase n=3 Tax=Pontibacillus yanchengensis TaxID=462910 RepID=A0ACC7VIM0_9BACI|nr:tyrosine-type recombinase/integrase [Pontibacillus yanchengensis]MYL54633.1 tyrosine-type recombinase/integrase [Pontibacillus yanchengensis]